MRKHLSPRWCRCRWLHCTGCEYILLTKEKKLTIWRWVNQTIFFNRGARCFLMGSLPGPTSKLLLLLLPVGSSCCGFLGADRLGSLPKNLVHVALVFFILPFAFHAWLYRVLWHSTTPPTDFGSTAVVVAVQNVGRFIYFPLSLRSELLAK